MRTSLGRILGTVSLLALVACSRATENLPVQNPSGEQGVTMSTSADAAVNTETTAGAQTAGDEMLPKDWPADVTNYAGADVVYAAAVGPESGKPGEAIVLQTKDSTTAVNAFYTTSLKSNGWKITGTMEGNGTSVMTASKDTRNLTIAISSQEGMTNITIAIEGAQ